jgi:5-methylcytosine-specific restriction protein A
MARHDPRFNDRSYRLLRLAILDRDGYLCRIRGPRCTTYATQVDHIVARADGGAMLDPANLRAACRRCNGWLAANRTNSLRYRYRQAVAVYETRL